MKIKKIKILQVVNLVGGVEVCVRQITENIDNSLFENVVVCQNLKDKTTIKDSSNNELKTYQLPIVRNINPIKDLSFLISTIKIILKEKPNVIHAHSAKGGSIARIASFFFNLTVIYTPHAFSYLSTNAKIKKRLFLFIEQILVFNHVVLLATSRSEQERAIKEVGYDRKRVQILQNAVNPIKTSKNNSSRVKHKHYLCSIGRPSFQKNTEMLINVFEKLAIQHTTLHLYIVGAGEYSPELNKVKRQIAEKNLLNRITIIPWVKRGEAMRILKNATLYVSTSRYEGMPYSVIESLCLSKTMVLTDCDGNKDLIQDGISGFLVKNINEMIKKISILLKNHEKRHQFENNAFLQYKKRHQLSNYIQTLSELYLREAK